MGLPRINQRNILMLVLSMSLISFFSTSLKICHWSLVLVNRVSGVSDALAYEFKRAFIVIGIDEDEFFEARYEDEFSELGQEFIGK